MDTFSIRIIRYCDREFVMMHPSSERLRQEWICFLDAIQKDMRISLSPQIKFKPVMAKNDDITGLRITLRPPSTSDGKPVTRMIKAKSGELSIDALKSKLAELQKIADEWGID